MKEIMFEEEDGAEAIPTKRGRNVNACNN